MNRDGAADGNHDHGSTYELLPRTSSPSPAPAAAGTPTKKRNCTWMPQSPIINTWLYEILAMLFSLSCFIAIVCILMVFEDKSRPSFAYGLTLNAIISILATASKSSLIYVIGECIGQLKWIWVYKQKRQLDDMQLFDSASRGPLGSLYMVLQHKGQTLASLGAVITILALMFDPFMQQILAYPTRVAVDDLDPGRSLAIAKRSFAFDPETFGADMQAIVNTGIWSQSPAHLEPNVTCSSGNCEWDEFVSLGMCSECEDITSETRFECSPHGFNNTPTSLNELAVIACYLIPPQGETFSVTVGLRYISPVYDFKALVINITEHNAWSVFTDIGLGNSADPRPNITYAGIMNPQFVIAHAELGLVQNRSTPSPISNIGRTFHIRKATQCAVGLCARTYNISVSNGTTAINVSSPHYGELFDDPESQPPPAAGSVMFWPMCWKPSDLAKVTDVQRSLNEANFTFCNIGDYSSMNSYFAGLSTVEFSLYEYPNNSFSEPTRDMRINDPPEQSVARIIRTGLESVMRDVAASFTQVGLAASNDTTQGTVFFFEVYVSVKWLWLLQPAALVLLGIVFLFLTVFTNKQQKLSLWRSSILAVLFHGLVHKEREGDVEGLSGTGKETDTADQMEKVAQGMHVRLRAVEQSRGLMLDQV